MASINIVWTINTRFDENSLIQLLIENKCIEKDPTHEYQKKYFNRTNISIQLFENKLVIQGKDSDDNKRLILDISKCNGLDLDSNNKYKFSALFPTSHNGILCKECNGSSLLITGKIENLDINFYTECKHKIIPSPPFYMLTNRILPDLNVIIGGHISKCLDMGYFENFEIVIPDFIMHVSDHLGQAKKKGISSEIDRLRKFESESKIKIFDCQDGFEVPTTPEELDMKEDDIILKIANLTNSILALLYSVWLAITIFTIFGNPFSLVPSDGKRTLPTCPQHSGSLVH